MTEHVWKIKCVCDTIFAYVGEQGNYKATMSEKEILARLNATERFVAFMEEYYSIRGKIEPESFDTEEDKILKAIYANILEGKDD